MGRIDVHGGYFYGAVAQRLIYRLACLGYRLSLAAFGSQDPMLRECADHQIRVLLSDQLPMRMEKPRENMNLSDSTPAA
jgi:hypothetical protein